MWGSRLNNETRKGWEKNLNVLLIAGKKAGEKGLDQDALRKYVWPLTKLKSISVNNFSSPF